MRRKIRTKIFVIFAVTLTINIFVVIFGLTFVLDSLSTKMMETVVEIEKDKDGNISKYIDVVAYFTTTDGSPRVIEVKLDFARSIVLLEAQYTAIETGALVIALALLIGLLGTLLMIIARTAVTCDKSHACNGRGE